VVMAAMTRCRADPKTMVPTELHEKYYSERAENAAFVLTECTTVSLRGSAFPGACGIYTSEQVEGWKKVTQAVHKEGGRIFLQIWHAGRASRSKDTGTVGLAPSPIPIRAAKEGAKDGYEFAETPEELTEDGIKTILAEFKAGAVNAKKAGFDGLEVHGANGYIVDQFLRDCTNKRTDSYGGSIKNRCKFALEIIDVCASVFGYDKVGIKLTPVSRYNDMYDSNPEELFKYLLGELSKKKIAFIEVVQAKEFPNANFYDKTPEEQMPDVFKTIRPFFKGTIIGNSMLDFDTGNKLIDDNLVDMVSFAKSYVANPDLVLRFKYGTKLEQPDWATLFGGGEKGYCDFKRVHNDKMEPSLDKVDSRCGCIIF